MIEKGGWNREQHTGEQQTRVTVTAAFLAKSSSCRGRSEEEMAVCVQDHSQNFHSEVGKED
jgi:hypothetical protein